MVASDRWNIGGSWLEVHTTAVRDLAPLSELAHERVDAIAKICATAQAAATPKAVVRTSRPTLWDELIEAELRVSHFSEGRVSELLTRRPSSEHTDNQERSPQAGEEFELPPIAAAWAADRIAEESLRRLGIACLVNLDGNVSVRGIPPAGGWQLHLEDGQPSSRADQPIPIWSGGLASARRPAPDTTRPDPKRPPRSWHTATVAAATCERAKAAALTALELGDSAPRWLTQRGLAARLVHTGGICVQTHGWAD